MNWKALWPTLLSLLPLIASAFSDQIAALLSANPTVYMLLVTLNTLLANFVKSPTAPK